MSKVAIENLTSNPVTVALKSGINGQVSNEGSQHFTDGEKGLMSGKFIQMMLITTGSKIQFVQTVEHRLSVENSQRPETGRRAFFMNYDFELAGNGKVEIEKRGNIYTSIDKDVDSHELKKLRAVAVDELQGIQTLTFDQLLLESAEESDKVWRKHPIKITSEDFGDQIAICFAQYHFHSIMPAHDDRMNIGAKGLSGEGYKGHTFWYTEVFMLSYFTFTHPELAKSLLTYRYRGLGGAHKKAASNGYSGAQYPWEAAWPTDDMGSSRYCDWSSHQNLVRFY